MAKRIVLECNADETLMRTLGITRKEIQPKYLSNFYIAEEQYGIRVLKHPNSHQTVLVICPMLEGWIVERCRNAHIRPEQYSLPSTAVSCIKSSTTDYPNFQNS